MISLSLLFLLCFVSNRFCKVPTGAKLNEGGLTAASVLSGGADKIGGRDAGRLGVGALIGEEGQATRETTTETALRRRTRVGRHNGHGARPRGLRIGAGAGGFRARTGVEVAIEEQS